MAGPNPFAALGNLNRLRGSLLFPLFPELNISAQMLAKEGIKLGIEGDTTDFIPAMVGMVQSQNVYLKCSISVMILKTNPLANAFKAKMESDSNLGPCSYRSDASQLNPYDFVNCAIERMEGIDSSGTSANYPLMIAGTYYVNSNLYFL